MIEVDAAIREVEQVYRSLTGHEVPPPSETPFSPIPPEKNAQAYIDEQLERLRSAMACQTAMPTWAPPVTMQQGPKELLICVDLPGVQRDRTQVSVSPTAITVTGQRVAPGDGKSGTLIHLAEPPVGAFARVIPLPPGAEPGEVRAQLKDGVLELRVPLPDARAEPTKVTIQ